MKLKDLKAAVRRAEERWLTARKAERDCENALYHARLAGTEAYRDRDLARAELDKATKRRKRT